MKRITLLFLALALAVSLVACGTSGSTAKDSNGPSGTSPVQPEEDKPTLEDTYQEAHRLMLEKKYDEAIELFESLGDYSNAKTFIKECKYHKAALLVQGKNYEAAYALLSQIKGYNDVPELLKKFTWKHTKMVKSTTAGADMTYVYSYTYDENGNTVASSYENEYFSGSYTYVNVLDEQGRIERITSTSAVGYVTIHNYYYNAQGLVEKLSSNYNGSYIQDIFYTYNDKGQVIREEVPDTESITDYTYDEQGNVTSMDGNIGSSSYVNTYDENGRLVKYVRTDGEFSTTFEFTYDQNGNIIKQVSTGVDGWVETEEYSDFVCFYKPN